MKPLKALIFDSYYDDYRGVILYVRIFSGELKKGDEIKMMATDSKGLALEIGKLQPKMTPFEKMGSGEIGYIVKIPPMNHCLAIRMFNRLCTLDFSQFQMKITKI